jgi:outer membrane protein assembly factor BamB
LKIKLFLSGNCIGREKVQKTQKKKFLRLLCFFAAMKPKLTADDSSLHLQSGGFEVLLAAMKAWLFLPLTFGLALAAAAQDTAVTNLWQFRLPDSGGESSPALAPDGTIYEGTFHGWLLALTPDGKLKWKFKAGLEIKSSPAVAADGTICFGSRDRKFYALNSAGKLKWSFTTGAWVDSSPAIAADGTIYFGSWDTNFYALNPGGQLKWSFATGGIVDSSPAIGADGTIYFGSHDRNFYALTPDGKLKWKFATGAEIIASPAIGADGTIYISSTDGNFYALNPDGTKRWRLHTGGYTSSSPVLDANGNLYFAVNTEQFSLAPDGKMRWHYDNANPISTSPAALADDQILVATRWSRSGMLSTAANTLWDLPSGHGFCGSPDVSPAGVIYLTDEHQLFAFQPLTNAAAPVRSSWPLWRADAQRTGRVQK